LIVRRALAADAEAIARVYAAVAEEGFLGAQPPVDVAERSERFRERIDKMWVLLDGERIVGHAHADQRVPGVMTFGMAILREARGRGGGRALLDAMLEHAREIGAHKVDLEVWADNARAIAVYAAAGFEVEGLRRDHYLRRDGTLRSTLIMAKRIRS